MQHPGGQLAFAGAKQLQHIAVSVPDVEGYRHVLLPGEAELPQQHFLLLLPGRVFVVVVQPDFPHAHDLGVLQPPGEIVQLLLPEAVGLLRMHAHHAVDGGVLAGQRRDAAAGSKVASRTDAAVHARRCHAGKHLFHFALKALVFQMAMGIKQIHHIVQRMYAPSSMPGSTVQSLSTLSSASEAHRIMPSLLIPLSLAGFRLLTSTT